MENTADIMELNKIDLTGNFSHQTIEELFATFQTSSVGLSRTQAEERLRVYGTNEFAKEKKKTILRKIIEALIEPMAVILIIASLLSFFIIQDPLEAIAILGVVIINTFISLFQEGKAEKDRRVLISFSKNDNNIIISTIGIQCLDKQLFWRFFI